MQQERVALTHAEALARAERALEQAVREASERPDPLKPKIHFSAPAQWLNDPNGFIYYKGEYHLFYQFHPYGNRWGPMHWGHAKSADLVHWEHLPIALAPSEPYDLDERGGCFSGSAVDDDGVLSLLYTGTVIRDGVLCQTQNLATSRDGVIFEKYEGNPVIAAYPDEGSVNFRDPKVWKHDGTWYMVLGSGKDEIGKALLYRSPDLRRWEYVGVLAESDGSLGYMWECPDFFPVGDRYALMFSPMGMGERKAIYLLGDMDYETGKFTWDRVGDTDVGFDYYAPQSLLDDKGRRIIIAWQNSWDWMPWFNGWAPPKVTQWCGSMSIPRVVEMDEQGRLTFKPVEEMKRLRGAHYRAGPTEVEAGAPLFPSTIDGREPLEMILAFRPDRCPNRFGLRLRGSADRSEYTSLLYDKGSRELRFDRSRSDEWSEGVRTVRLPEANGERLVLHLFVDVSTVDVLTDSYATALTSNMYPDAGNDAFEWIAEGGPVVLESVDVWQLRSIWE